MARISKPHYAWTVCLGCALMLFCTSGLSINAFSIYQPFMLTLNGFSNTEASLVLTARNLASLVSMLLARRYYRRVPLRTGMGLAGGALVLAYFLFGVSGKSFPLYCLSSALTGVAYGLGTMIPVAIALGRWFHEKRNTALGVCSAVTGLSTLGFPSLIAKAVGAFGLGRAFLFEGAAMGALILLSVCLIRSRPEDMGLLPCGAGAETETEAKRTPGLAPSDWLILLPMLLLTGAVMNVSYTHLTVLMTGEGYSPETAATAVLVSGLALTAGKILYGRLGDKIGNYRSNYLFAAMLIAGFFLFRFMKAGTPVLLTAALVYSFGMAGLSVGLSAWPGDLVSGEAYETAVQRFQAGYAAGSLLFSPLPGMMADRAGGSYLSAFLLFTGFAFLVLFAIQAVYRRARRRL